MSAANGNGHAPRTEAQAEEALTARPLTLDYRPSWGLWAAQSGAGGRFGDGWAHIRDIDRMLDHPDVALPYGYYLSGISDVKFTAKAKNSAQAQEGYDLLTKLWAEWLTKIQLCYDFGWCGYELGYEIDRGILSFSTLLDLHPLDCWALTRRGEYRGFRLSGSGGPLPSAAKGGHADLWGPGKWPAKGLWLVHAARWDRFHGRSQLRGAWRPWRRLAGIDCAEDVVDGAVYRGGYQGPTVYYPPDAYRKKGGGELDYEAASNEARRMAEQLKAGGSMAMPNTRIPNSNEPAWKVDWPQGVMNVDPLLNYEASLQKQISRGVGVPPELIEASDTGSGWSGRKVPMLGFYNGQRGNARNLTRQLVTQLVVPILRWNHGDDAWFEADVEVVLPEALSGEPKQPPTPTGGALPPQPDQGAPQADPLAALMQGGAEMSAAAEPEPEAKSRPKFTLSALPPEEGPEAVLDDAATPIRQLARAAREALLASLAHASPADAPRLADAWAADWGPRLAQAASGLSLSAGLAGMASLARSLEQDAFGDSSWVQEHAEDLPMIRAAAEHLAGANLLALPQYMQLKSASDSAGLSLAQEQVQRVVSRVREAALDAVRSGSTLEDFRKRVAEGAEGYAVLSPAQAETVFRTNVMSAYSAGQEAMLAEPAVADAYPYAAYHATHDARVRPEHLALEKAGIGGTNVYRRDDPVWQMIRPPAAYNCRCTTTPLTVAEAARRGIAEAQQWLATGKPPATPSHVQAPAFRPEPEFQRPITLSGADDSPVPPGTAEDHLDGEPPAGYTSFRDYLEAASSAIGEMTSEQAGAALRLLGGADAEAASMAEGVATGCGYELSAAGRYEQRKITRGPRKDRVAWYDTAAEKFMPDDFYPPKSAREASAATPTAAAPNRDAIDEMEDAEAEAGRLMEAYAATRRDADPEAPETAEALAARRASAEAVRRLGAAKAAYQAATDEALASLLPGLKVGRPAEIPYDSLLRGNTAKWFDRAARLVCSVTSGSLSPPEELVVVPLPPGGRPVCSADLGEIHLPEFGDEAEALRVSAHELGHWIESHKPGVLEKTAAFVERRCAGKPPVRLRSLPGGEDCHESEEGRLGDGFGRLFGGSAAYYLGKVYREGGRIAGTEVMSCGLELLLTDPLRLRRDRELYDLIIDCLRG